MISHDPIKRIKRPTTKKEKKKKTKIKKHTTHTKTKEKHHTQYSPPKISISATLFSFSASDTEFSVLITEE